MLEKRTNCVIVIVGLLMAAIKITAKHYNYS